MRKDNEDDFSTKQKIVKKSYSEANRVLAQEKSDKDYTQKGKEDSDNKNHLEFNTTNKFCTENTETCQSQLAPHRVIPYHWKGMNEHQRKEILTEQEKQRKEAENIKSLQKEEERLYAMQAEVSYIV